MKINIFKKICIGIVFLLGFSFFQVSLADTDSPDKPTESNNPNHIPPEERPNYDPVEAENALRNFETAEQQVRQAESNFESAQSELEKLESEYDTELNKEPHLQDSDKKQSLREKIEKAQEKADELKPKYEAAKANAETSSQNAIDKGSKCPPEVLCVELAEPIIVNGKKVFIFMAGSGEDKDGLYFLMKYASAIYKYMAGIVGFIAVLVLVVSGLQISASGLSGEANAVGEAKERIMRALMALALVFMTGVLLYTVNPVFFTL